MKGVAVVVMVAVAAVVMLATSAVAVADADVLREFKAFVRANGRHYNAHEFAERLTVFRGNMERIEQLNAEHPHAHFGMSKFMDLTADEFRRFYLGTRVPARPKDVPVAALYSPKELQAIPTNYDWTTHSPAVVTPVKNQGQCGSCWAFSTTGNVEGIAALATGKLVSLSEQNLVDCDHECGTYRGMSGCDAGCDGGLQPNAFSYIIKNHGIDTEASYPYAGVDGTCQFSAANVGATISNFTMVSEDEDQMAAYLFNHGPVSVAVDAATCWQFYMFGVLDGPCGTQLDHGVLLVGYGEEVDDLGFNIKFWKIKNSWGESWGEDGYIRIERGVNECGVSAFACSSIH